MAAAAVAAAQQGADAAARGAPPAELLYSDGCTLAVSGTAQPLLLSGSMCNPPQRPLGEISVLNRRCKPCTLCGSGRWNLNDRCVSCVRRERLMPICPFRCSKMYVPNIANAGAVLIAAAAWLGGNGGRVAVFGAAAVFDGEALQRPGNAAACDALFEWLRPVSTSDVLRRIAGMKTKMRCSGATMRRPAMPFDWLRPVCV